MFFFGIDQIRGVTYVLNIRADRHLYGHHAKIEKHLNRAKILLKQAPQAGLEPATPMINSLAPWLNRVKLQQIRITIQSPDLYSQLLKNKPVYVVCEVRERLVKSLLTS